MPQSPFSPLRSELLIETDEIILVAPFYYKCHQYNITIEAPENFICNGLSIPPFLWPIFGHPFRSDNIKQAVIHDYLYIYQPYSRRMADNIFYYSLLYDNRPIPSAALYTGVRMFGYLPWKRHKKALKG